MLYFITTKKTSFGVTIDLLLHDPGKNGSDPQKHLLNVHATISLLLCKPGHQDPDDIIIFSCIIKTTYIESPH